MLRERSGPVARKVPEFSLQLAVTGGDPAEFSRDTRLDFFQTKTEAIPNYAGFLADGFLCKKPTCVVRARLGTRRCDARLRSMRQRPRRAGATPETPVKHEDVAFRPLDPAARRVARARR